MIMNKPRWPCGDSEMANRIRSHDWSATPLGPIEGWPSSLRFALGTVLDNPFPMALAWGPDHITFHNDAYRPLLGDVPDALGRPFLEVWDEAGDTVASQMARALAGEAVRVEGTRFKILRHGRPEEAFFDYAFSPVRDETGAVVGLLNIAVEATDRVRAEAALRAGERRLRDVLDGMGESFGLMDHEMRIITQNEAALRLDGRPLEEIRGRTHWEVYPGSEDSVLGRLYKRALAEQAPVSLEHRYEFPSGGAKWLEMRAYPVPEGLAVFWRDITGRKESE